MKWGSIINNRAQFENNNKRDIVGVENSYLQSSLAYLSKPIGLQSQIDYTKLWLLKAVHQDLALYYIWIVGKNDSLALEVIAL